jgi:hypothetical protein
MSSLDLVQIWDAVEPEVMPIVTALIAKAVELGYEAFKARVAQSPTADQTVQSVKDHLQAIVNNLDAAIIQLRVRFGENDAEADRELATIPDPPKT